MVKAVILSIQSVRSAAAEEVDCTHVFTGTDPIEM
jgi:hypothetical protein